MQKYELLYIVPAQYTDDEVGTIQEKIAALVEKIGGKVIRNENLGKIKLAYPINKVRHGSYVLVYFDAEGKELKELDRLLRLSDEVLRHTVIDRPEGAEEATFELSSYVPPFSEEGKRTASKTKTERPTKREKEVKKEAKKEEVKKKAEQVTPPAPSDKTAEESKMTMQELDQQLDKILEGDIGENI